jgi:lipopolysaccharide/colanic/teichoic acid biosynthesis glycosyltransferase
MATKMATKTDRIVVQRLHRWNWYNQGFKRIFDIIVSAVVLVLISPILGLIATAIQRDSPGPVFFRGNRIGQGGKIFKILKFRTMYETPKSYAGPRVTAQDDPRVTPFGRWLRDTKVNELPQFWNVLKGEMSLVGPRPEDPSIAKTWPRKVRDEILSVRPGITSPASVQYRNEEALLSYGGVISQYLQDLTPDKMRLDQLYVRYRSFWLDLDVILWTALIFIPRIGSMTLPEELLFVGPFTRLIRRYLNWFTIDLLITFSAISLTGLIWRAFEPLNLGWIRAASIAFGFAFLFSLTEVIMGVNRITWSKASFADAYELIPPWLIAFTIALLLNWQMALFPWALVVVASVIALGGFVIVRYSSRLITAFLVSILHHTGGEQTARERVLIVGSGRTAEHIAWLLDHPTFTRKYQVVGFVENDLLSKGMRIYGASVVGNCQELSELVENLDVGLILLADHRLTNKECLSIIEACVNLNVVVMCVPDLFGSLNRLTKDLPDKNTAGEDGRDKSDYRCQRCLARYGAPESEGVRNESYEI